MYDIYGFEMHHVRINGQSVCSIEEYGHVHACIDPLPSELGKHPNSDFEENARRVVEFFRNL